VATDYFLNIDSIQGESTDKQYAGEKQLGSWSFGETRTATSAPSGAGKVQMKDFHFLTELDKVGPQIFAH
jgi:type VI secretion system secreted protein Hcp